MSNHTITVNYEGMVFDVEFDYYQGSLGVRDKNGLQLEPDEQTSWEILKISMLNPDDDDIAPVYVTDCFGKTMSDWFEDQVGDYIGSYL